MIRLLIIYLSNLLALGISGWLLFPGLPYDVASLSLAALVLTVLNWLLRPLLMVIALPLNLITLGLFVLVINAWIVMLADMLVSGWQMPGFWASLATGVIVLVFNIYSREIARQAKLR